MSDKKMKKTIFMNYSFMKIAAPYVFTYKIARNGYKKVCRCMRRQINKKLGSI